MWDQESKAAGKREAARTGTPANHADPPAELERLADELAHIIKRNPTERYLHCLINCALAYEKALR